MRVVLHRPVIWFVTLALAAPLWLAPAACDKDKAKDHAATQPGQQPKEGESAGGTEITANPQVLYDPSVAPSEFLMYGVKIGDPDSAIPASGRTGKPDESGWIGFRGRANVFRVENGVVHNMSVTDPQVLSKLDIKDEEDVKQKFGKDYNAGQFGAADVVVPYFFKDRWLTVTWDRRQGKVTQINVGL